MMKKVLAVALASCMIFSSATVFAAESTAESTAAADATTEALDLKWEDIKSLDGIDEILSQGQVYTFEDVDVNLWVPDVMAPVELADEDKEAGYIGYFATEEGDGVASVVYVNVDGVKSVEDYATLISEIDGVSDIEFGTVNGLPAVSYMMDDTDTACVSFATEQGNLLEFSFYPASDEAFQQISAIMTCSIMNAEDANAESGAASVAESAAESAAE